MSWNFDEINSFLAKWLEVLRLRDWDIKLRLVEKEWRKTGDIKVDMDDRTAILLINVFNPKQTNLEELVIHELLHLKLWHMDQTADNLFNLVYGANDEDPKFEFAYTQYMHILESTVNDLTKTFLELAGDNKNLSYGRLEKQILDEIGI